MTSLFTLPNVMAGIIVLSLNAYVLSGGADFGGGMWDLLASGPRRDRQRELIAHAIGPIWEANHVWLIFVVVLLFTCFPPAFATITTELHVPLALLLIGIVLRGSAFTFRTFASSDRVRNRWGLVFSLSSFLTPVLLGAAIGALASGAVGRASSMTTSTFSERFIAPWANPFVLGVGAMALALFAFLAAVYLTVEAEGERELQEDFRRRALGSAAAVFVCAFGALALAGAHAPRMMDALTRSPAAIPLQVATGVSALVAIAALIKKRFRAARIAAVAQVSLILWGWAAGQFPYLVPPTLSLESAAASPVTLRLTLIAVIVGVLIVIPSLIYLLRVFKSQPTA
jgi:cytochrome d ubiquinol oxidase subunit II